jgi:hypothetical protein
MAGHPLLLVGPDMDLYTSIISNAFQCIFNPDNLQISYDSKNTSIVRDIIKLDHGKYIVTFNAINTMLASLIHNLYYDTARIVINPDVYYELSIADITKHHYIEPTEFMTVGPYKKYPKPFILYKKKYSSR